MPELIIEQFPGPWIGNDYGGETKKNLNAQTGKLVSQPYVSMVKVP